MFQPQSLPLNESISILGYAKGIFFANSRRTPEWWESKGPTTPAMPPLLWNKAGKSRDHCHVFISWWKRWHCGRTASTLSPSIMVQWKIYAKMILKGNYVVGNWPIFYWTMMMGGNQNPMNNHETVEELFCHGFLLATFQMSVGFRKGHGWYDWNSVCWFRICINPICVNPNNTSDSGHSGTLLCHLRIRTNEQIEQQVNTTHYWNTLSGNLVWLAGNSSSSMENTYSFTVHVPPSEMNTWARPYEGKPMANKPWP